MIIKFMLYRSYILHFRVRMVQLSKSLHPIGRFDWVKKTQEVIVSHGQNVTVDVLIGSKCHSGRSELGRNVQAALLLVFGNILFRRHITFLSRAS